MAKLGDQKIVSDKPNYPNIEETLKDLDDMLTYGIIDGDSVRPATLNDVKSYVSKDYGTIQKFAESLDLAYGFDNAFYNGMMLNYGAEFGAIYDTLAKGGSYQENYRDRALGQRLYEMENPLTAMGAEIAGSTIPSAVIGGLGTVKNVQSAVKLGAFEGAIAGSGSDENALGRILSAGMGAGLGGLSAGIFVGVTGFVTGMKRKFDDVVGRNTDATSNRVLSEVMDADNVLPDTMDGQPVYSPSDTITPRLQRLSQEMGTEAVPADISKGLENIAETAVETVGPTRQQAQFLNQRKLGSRDRIQEKFETETGFKDVDTEAEAELIKKQELPKSRPFYKKAYEADRIFDDEIADIMTQPDFQIAYQRAVKTARREGVTDPNAPILPDKMPTPEEGYTVAQLDYTKRAIDQMIKRAIRNPDASISQTSGGLDNNDVNALINMRDVITTRLDNLVPAYKTARAKFAFGMDADRALQLGKNFKNKTPNRIKNELKKLKSGQLKYYKMASAESLLEWLSTKKGNRNLGYELQNDKVMLDRFKTLFGTQESFDKFVKSLNANAQAFETAGILRGSKTSRVLGTRDFVDEDTIGEEIAKDIATYGRLGPLRTAGRKVQNRLSGKTPRVMSELGPMMLERDPLKAGRNITSSYEDNLRRLKMMEEMKRRINVPAGGLLGPMGAFGFDENSP